MSASRGRRWREEREAPHAAIGCRFWPCRPWGVQDRGVLEKAAVRLGQEVVKQVARAWLGHRRAVEERESELVDLIAVGVVDRFHRRKLVRQLEDIGDQVALRLRPVLERECHGLSEGETRAALDTAVETLTAADLSDRALFAADASPSKLAQAVHRTNPVAASQAGLNEAGQVLYRRVVDEACSCLLHIVRQLPEFQPRAIVELLDRVSTATEAIERVLERLPRAVPEDAGSEAGDAEFTRRYLGYISESMDRLELFGVDVRQYRPHTSVTTAYLTLSVTAAPRPGNDLTDRHRGGNGEMRVEEALSRCGYVLLRGEAGSGKTTLLQWIAVTAALAGFAGPLAAWNEKIPFVVPLRAYAEAPLPSPEEIAAANAGPLAGELPAHWPTACFRTGQALLLVDGVDELTRVRRRKVRSWLAKLLAAFPDINLVITSRPSAAEATWLDDQGFQSLFLEPMTPDDIDAFCRRWHKAVQASAENGAVLPCASTELAGYEAALARQLKAKPHLRALATTPLLCAMLCALNLDRHKQLPPDRMKLYEAALEMLLERRDTERDIPQDGGLRLDLTTKTALLQYLAWWLTQCGRSELSTEDAVERISFALTRLPTVDAEPAAVLQYLLERSGLIREPVLGRLEFVHRTFQEYLAGKQAAEEHLTELLVRNAHLDQWRETVVMGAGHMTPRLRAEVLTGLLDRADSEPRQARRLRVVAAACLETTHAVAPEVAERVEAALDVLTPPRNRREARSLALAGEQVLRHLPEELSELTHGAAAACTRAAAFVSSTKALDVLSGYATDPREKIQIELASAWKYHSPEEYATKVLAEAPLVDGAITVERVQHIPYLQLLKKLKTTRIHLIHDDTPDDLTFLDEVPNLTVLQLPASFTDVKPVDVETLVKHTGLTFLATGWRPLARLKPVEQLSGLEALLAVLPDEVDDLTFVQSLKFLRRLDLRNCSSLRSLKPLRECAPLTKLGIWDAQSLTECKALQSVPSIDNLAVHKSPVGNKELSEVIPTLHNLAKLNLHTCPNVNDLAALVDAPVVMLWLWGSSVQNLAPLRHMRLLQDIALPYTPVTDISPLVDLPNLKRLDLRGVPEDLDLRPLTEVISVSFMSCGVRAG